MTACKDVIHASFGLSCIKDDALIRSSLRLKGRPECVACPVGFYQALTIGIQAHIGHGGKRVRQIVVWWAQQRSGEDRPEFRLLADAMGACGFLERLQEGLLPLSVARLWAQLTSS